MFRRSVEWFLGSVVVYILTAACAATGGVQGMMDMATGGLASMLGGNSATGAQGSDGQGAESSGAQASDGSGADNSDGEGATGGTSILDPVPDADAAEDGTRIVNSYWTTADGLKTPAGFFDEDLDVACTFAVTEDQKQRCLPTNVSGVVVNYYSNDTCTVRVGYMSKGGCPKGKYAWATVIGDACTSAPTYYHYEVFEIGEKLTAPTIYSNSSGSCAEPSPTTYDNYDFYELTAIAQTTFAEGSLVQGGQ